jgi:hypothetical protein
MTQPVYTYNVVLQYILLLEYWSKSTGGSPFVCPVTRLKLCWRIHLLDSDWFIQSNFQGPKITYMYTHAFQRLLSSLGVQYSIGVLLHRT